MYALHDVYPRRTPTTPLTDNMLTKLMILRYINVYGANTLMSMVRDRNGDLVCIPMVILFFFVPSCCCEEGIKSIGLCNTYTFLHLTQTLVPFY